MNNDIWSTVLHNYLKEEVFYIVTLFDKRFGIILMQEVAIKDRVLDTVYDIADSALVKTYPKRDVRIVDSLGSTRYYLRDIYSIDQREINDENFRLYIRRVKIHQ